ncbi:unnamed protein product, partial [Symbiodinium sp. KB8]
MMGIVNRSEGRLIFPALPGGAGAASQNAHSASGLYQLCRHRGNWRPVYRKVVDAEFQDEEETKAVDLFELSYVPPSGRGKKNAGRWEIRAPGAEAPLETIA